MERKDVCTYRTYEVDGKKKKSWCRIGTAFCHSDGSINIEFTALPLNGRVSIFERKPFEGPADTKPAKQADPNDLPF